MSVPRVVFMGTAEFAVDSLAVLAERCDVLGVVTRPDRPRGRGLQVSASPVAAAAASLGLDVLKPENPNDPETIAALRALEPDLFAVVAFGAILSSELLAVPRLGSINLHGSLLPDYRGAAPIQRALWDGRPATGVTTLWIDEGIDTGDLILQAWQPIRAEDDAGSLGRRLSSRGATLLWESVDQAIGGRAPRRPQDRAAGGYARKLTKADARVDWSLDVETIWNRQRAVTPRPGALTALRGRHVRLIRTRPLHRLPSSSAPGSILGPDMNGVAVACGAGVLLVLALAPEGKPEMEASDWLRGARLEAGARFEAEVPA